MSESDALQALVGDDEWLRHRVLERLRAAGASDDQLAAFRSALGDPNATARAAARMALAATAAEGSPSAAPARRLLLDALGSRDEGLRVLAASALGESGSDDAVGPLIDALDDPSSNVAAAAADALGQLGAPAAVGPLAARIGTEDLWVRAAVVVALGRLRDARALTALARVARQPGLEVPLIEALLQISDPDSLPVLQQVSRTAPLDALLAAGALLSAFPDTAVPAWVRAAALEHEAELRARLSREDDPAVARLVGIAGHPQGLEMLVDLAGPPRRSEAALAGLLAAPPRDRAVPLVAHLAAADPDDMVTLLSLLPPVEDPDHIAVLVPLLSHDDPDVRGAAAAALARAPADTALPLLTAELERAGAAPEVVRAMGGLRDTVCAALVPLMTDPSPEVRTAAAEALARCAGASAAAALEDALAEETWPATRRALLRALGSAGGPLGPLVLALDDPDPETRVAAIEALGTAGDRASVPHLRRHLDRPAPEAEALAALRALGQVGNGGAAEGLVPSFASPDLERRRAAVHSAVALAPHLPEDAVRRVLTDADEWVRVGAARILARRGEEGQEALARLASSDRSPAVRAEARRLLDREG